jgi:hypothetical protein
MVLLLMVAGLMGVVIAVGALVFGRPRARWLWASSIALATIGLVGGALAGILFLFAKTWSVDELIASSAWLTLLSQAAGIAIVCLLPFAVGCIVLGRKARQIENRDREPR